MRVLFLLRSLIIPGGWERYSRGLIAALAEKGVEPVIAAVDPTPLAGFPFAPEPAVLKWAEWGRRMALTTPLNLLKIRPCLKGVDLIHAVVEPLAPLAEAASRLTGRPFVITAHGTFAAAPFATGSGKGRAARVFARAGAIACVSAYTRRIVTGHCPAAKATAIPNGYTPPQVEPSPQPVVERPYFLTVGPLKKRKGQHLILKAWARLADEFPDVDWVIAGFSYQQRYPETFRRLAAEAGLQDRIRILGRVGEAELQRLYADCLFYALTPVNDDYAFEGFGLTYLEAGWHEKPSVASLGCGAGESITDGVEGFLVGQDDVEALTEALRRLLTEAELRRAMGRAARKRAETMTWAATAERMLQIYRDLT